MLRNHPPPEACQAITPARKEAKRKAMEHLAKRLGERWKGWPQTYNS